MMTVVKIRRAMKILKILLFLVYFVTETNCIGIAM